MQKGFTALFILIGLTITAAIGGGAYYLYSQQKIKNINSFEECVKAGYPVMQIYPPRCNTPDGRSFTKELSEEEKKKLNPLQVEDEIANWKTYTNTKNSFSIKYPDNKRIDINEKKPGKVSCIGTAAVASFEIYPLGYSKQPSEIDFMGDLLTTISVEENKEHLNLNEWVQKNCKELLNKSKIDKILVNGIEGLKLEPSNVMGEQINILLPKLDNIYLINGFSISKSPLEELFIPQVHTFKFLDQEDDDRTVDNLCTSVGLGGPFRTVKDCDAFKVLVRPCCDQVDIIVDSSGNKIAECGGLKGYSEECKKKFSPQTQCSVNSC